MKDEGGSMKEKVDHWLTEKPGPDESTPLNSHSHSISALDASSFLHQPSSFVLALCATD